MLSGVRILRGTSGTGKTTVLKVLQALLGDKDAVCGNACLVSLGGCKVSIQELLWDLYNKLVEYIDVDELSSESDPVVHADKLKRALDRSALEIGRSRTGSPDERRRR